jgi:hypothetical protein
MSDDKKIIKKNLFSNSNTNSSNTNSSNKNSSNKNSLKNTQSPKAVKAVKAIKSVKEVKSVKSVKADKDKMDKTNNTNNIEKKTDSSLLKADIVLNDDLLDMLEGMTDRLEESSNMAEKIKLHSEIKNSTSRIKNLIDMLIEDVDNVKILEDPANIYADDFIEKDSERFDILSSVHNLETDLSKINKTDDLVKQVEIYKNLQRKCEILKNAANNGDLIIKKCN